MTQMLRRAPHISKDSLLIYNVNHLFSTYGLLKPGHISTNTTHHQQYYLLTLERRRTSPVWLADLTNPSSPSPYTAEGRFALS